jgi:hypothetical protein
MSVNDYLVRDNIKDIVPQKNVDARKTDDFMYSNSEPISYYARGNGVDLTSNSDLYEIIKVVKDLTDKHFFVRDLVWKVDVKRRRAIFTFKLGNGDEEDQYFLDGVKTYILTNVGYKMGPNYSSESELLKNEEGQLVLKLTIMKDQKE